MLHLIPAPLHRLALRIAYRLRAAWRRRVRRPTQGVVVIARDRHERVLLVRHSYGSGRWALPGGGRGRSEHPEACARREMREEIGCELVEIELVEVTQSTFNGAPNTSHVFAARIEGEVCPDRREVLEAQWFSLLELPDDMIPMSRRHLRTVD